jgi:hypothetical protein
MLNLIRQTVKLPCSDEQEELVLTFDQPAARGTLILRECTYGLELLCPDVSPYPLAVLDLWHASPEVDEPAGAAPPVQIVIHSPAQTEDPLGRVRFFPRRTQVDFERGVERCDVADGDFFFAYPLGDYPPVEQIVNHQGVRVFRALDGDGQSCPTWFTTDPARANLAADGPHFCLADIVPVPSLAATQALADLGKLSDLLRVAIAAGHITPAGWQDRPAGQGEQKGGYDSPMLLA